MKKIIIMLTLVTSIASASAAYHEVIDPKVAATKVVEDTQAFWETGTMTPELSQKVHNLQASNKEMSKEEAMDIVITGAQASMQ